MGSSEDDLVDREGNGEDVLVGGGGDKRRCDDRRIISFLRGNALGRWLEI